MLRHMRPQTYGTETLPRTRKLMTDLIIVTAYFNVQSVLATGAILQRRRQRHRFSSLSSNSITCTLHVLHNPFKSNI